MLTVSTAHNAIAQRMKAEQGGDMNLLGMFARCPEPGKTKTRLAATIGDTAAAELYAAFVDDLAQRCPSLADCFLLAVTPDEQATADWFQPRLQSNSRLVFQPTGDLGQRIDCFFRQAADLGAKRIVLVGSDSPDLPDAIIESAFQRLQHVDVVISPATDGGYVLIGLRQPRPELFAGIRFSAPTTLSETLAAASQRGLTVELLQPWYDIDVAENLGTLLSLQTAQGSGAADCPATLAVLQRLWPRISTVME